MENKHVGFLVLGIAVVLVFIIFLFQNTVKELVVATCGLPHAASCPATEGIKQQTYLSLGIVGILLVIGFVLVFTKPKERIVIKKLTEKKKKLDLNGLEQDEKKIMELLLHQNGAMFQSALMEKLGAGKVKTTRVLDKLEAKQLIERKRRGMNNIVVLRD